MLDFLLWSIAIVNLMGFLLMGLDKWWSRSGKRRVPEGHLLLLALLAGFPGVWIGMTLFRHKSQKKAFQWKLLFVTLLNGAWAFAWWSMHRQP